MCEYEKNVHVGPEPMVAANVEAPPAACLQSQSDPPEDKWMRAPTDLSVRRSTQNLAIERNPLLDTGLHDDFCGSMDATVELLVLKAQVRASHAAVCALKRELSSSLGEAAQQSVAARTEVLWSDFGDNMKVLQKGGDAARSMSDAATQIFSAKLSDGLLLWPAERGHGTLQ